MKNLKLILVLAALPLTACVTMRQPLLSTPAVSMTTDSVKPGHKAVDLGPVTSKYCYGEPATTKKGDSVGLMDEVVMRAQQEKKATYISNANFSYEGMCIVLEGNAMRAD